MISQNPSARPAFDRELASIRDNIVRMGSLVDQAIERAFAAFHSHDSALAQQVIDEDKVINDLRYKTEQDVNACMALQQPMAHDLRMLLSSFIISNELERMGDYAEGIGRTVLRYPQEGGTDIPSQISDMTEYVRQMLRDAMDAYLNEDAQKAEITAQMDDRIDTLYRQMFKNLVEQMGTHAINIEHGTYMLWTGHNLERIGDRVTNLCERVIFIRTGTTGREMNPKHKEPPLAG
jgi:phosphate transport system protein